MIIRIALTFALTALLCLTAIKISGDYEDNWFHKALTFATITSMAGFVISVYVSIWT